MLFHLFECCTHVLLIESDTCNIEIYGKELPKNKKALEFLKLFKKVHINHEKMPIITDSELRKIMKVNKDNKVFFNQVLLNKVLKDNLMCKGDFTDSFSANELRMLKVLHDKLKLDKGYVNNIELDYPAFDSYMWHDFRSISIEDALKNYKDDVLSDADDLWSYYIYLAKDYINTLKDTDDKIGLYKAWTFDEFIKTRKIKSQE
ncbi:hypothetical protein D3C81_07500 [compost metagenome]